MQSSSRTKRPFEPIERSEVLELWGSRFGMPEDAFEDYCFYKRAQSIWVFRYAMLPKFSYEAMGMRMISLKDKSWKPTTCALQIFGRRATKNIVNLAREQAKAFLAGDSQALVCDSEPGYVVIFYKGDVLGCGLYSHGRLISQLPKERRMVCDWKGDDI